MTSTTQQTVAPAAPRSPATAPASFVALMYHNVCRDGDPYADLSPSATSYFVGESSFREQVAAVVAAGASFMAPVDLAPFYGPSPAGQRSGVLLTFDDGWRDAVEVAGPVLAVAGAQALLFVTTDFVGQRHFVSHAELSRGCASQFRIGSHARSHRMLSLLGDAEIREELAYSKKYLEDAVGAEVDALSIPSGAVDRRVRRVAGECGFRFLFDSEVRVNHRGGSPLAIGRVAVMAGTPVTAVRRYACGQGLPERLRRAVLSAPKRVLGLRRYEKLRRRLLGEKSGQQVTHAS